MSFLIINALVILGLMLVVWLISLPLKDVSIIDLVWGAGFAVVAWSSFIIGNSSSITIWLLLGLTTIWGMRLSAYLAWRNVGKPEDRRYAKMREKWGSLFPIVSLFTVFLLQGVVMWVVSLPVQYGVQHGAAGWSPWHLVGGFAWLVGIFFEAVGDWQLARFKSKPENNGKVLDEGLWRYTRHPNYFGDFCVWWGLYLVAIGGGAPWWTAIGPLVMSGFLMFLSGVTLLEKDLKQRKPDYADYIERTNAFFPGPPVSDSHPAANHA